MNVTLVGNCQLGALKDSIERFSKQEVSVKYIVSYQNLNNVSFVREAVSSSNIVIIQPIKNYEGLRLKDFQSYLSRNTSLLVFPFVRFSGFWDTKRFVQLQKFSSQVVKDFPRLQSLSEVDSYISGELTTSKRVLECFDIGMDKLLAIEKSSDIKFVEYFQSNYKYQPLFADQWHPTPAFTAYIQREQLKLIDQLLSLDWVKINDESNISFTSKCKGHFTPLNNKTRLVLGLKYNPEYFLVSRRRYLYSILKHELNGSSERVEDFGGLNEVLKA